MVALLRAIGVLLLSALLFPGGAQAQEEQTGSATDPSAVEQIAAMYAPRVVVRQNSDPCGPGEPFSPAAVTDVLGRPDVLLDQPNGEQVPAPGVGDLAGSAAEAHLNLPGDPLNPDCDYALWWRGVAEGQPPTLYAHVATDPAHPGQLALQYWFYWVFNDWNNRHEGDWEMIQILFPAATPEQALAVVPTSVAYAQHEGSETSGWDDPKLIRDGTHPVVYPSEGSHAAYFDQSQWFGKSAAAGFGCDNTAVSPDVPGQLWQPEVIVVPRDPQGADPQFGWLAYPGHWGQQEPSFNNGPTGPNTKEQWAAPITWQLQEGRSGAVAIPTIPGPAVSTFCGLTEQGSILFIELLDRPVLTVGVIAIVLVALFLLVRGTAWRGFDATVYDRERRSGQILTAAAAIYLRRFPLFAGLGAVFLAVSAAASMLAEAILGLGSTTQFVDTKGTSDPFTLLVAGIVSVALRGPVIVLVVSAAIAVAARQHRQTSFAGSLRRSVAPPTTVLLLAGTYLVAVLLAATVIGIPLALWLVARWASAGPAAMVEGLGLRAALSRSAALTHRKRLRTLALMALFAVFVLLPGPLAGAALLLVTDLPFAVVNAIVAISYAVTLPIFGVALTLQFYDLRQEDVRDGAPIARAAA